MSASSTVFTHVVLTAPAQAIADVYKVQLQALGESLPFLRGAVVECFPDPIGHRVGSGGGTLNALRCLQEKYNISSFASARVLLIHSGGESRRAPLYSLIGKAWTTVNGTLEGGDIACPLTLLIKEITIFCANLPEGSVVVASSDVMLNVAGPHCSSLKFADNSVCLVTVPETPTTAKNHGVLVLADVSNAGARCSVGVAVKYMQKPTLEELQAAGALYDATDSTSSKDSFALVDTGVVTFTGSATHALEILLSDSAMANCTLRGLDSGNNSNRPLRLELYTEVLLALAFGNQTDFDISVYHKRLGLDRHQLHSEVDEQYLRALTVLWDTMKNVPLTAVFVPTGAFEHLGTTAEVLELLVAEPDRIGTAGATKRCASRKERKLQQFAAKYDLRKNVYCCNSGSPGGRHTVLVNSYLSGAGTGPSVREGDGDVACVVEHSVLSGSYQLPNTGFVSHVCASLGKDLVVNEGVMMQKVYLHREHGALPAISRFALLLLGITDDVKRAYSDGWKQLCGAPWPQWEVRNKPSLHSARLNLAI
jgi:hypothetical protein